MKHERLLSISDVERIVDEQYEPNEGVYWPSVYSALEELVKSRAPKLKSEKHSDDEYCTCWGCS